VGIQRLFSSSVMKFGFQLEALYKRSLPYV
jgi:hypothetical protein